MQGKENNPLYSAAMDLIVRANWCVYRGKGRRENRRPAAWSSFSRRWQYR